MCERKYKQKLRNADIQTTGTESKRENKKTQKKEEKKKGPALMTVTDIYIIQQ